MSNAFDYVKYDEKAAGLQESFKGHMLAIVAMMNGAKLQGRAASLALTKLEETYMWLGKAVRDDQIARNGSAPLQEERTNS